MVRLEPMTTGKNMGRSEAAVLHAAILEIKKQTAVLVGGAEEKHDAREIPYDFRLSRRTSPECDRLGENQHGTMKVLA